MRKSIYACMVYALLLFQCSERDLVAPEIEPADSSDVPGAKAARISAATTRYISPGGNDAADGSATNPWRTLRSAVTKVPANQGYTLQLSAGTFVESGLVEVPLGVNVVGAGVDQTILKAASSFYYNPGSPSYAQDKFLISLNEYNQLNGNQLLRGFTIDGDGKKLHGGIWVRHRNNVSIEAVKVQNTNFTGIWLWDVKDSRITNTKLINCSWGSSAYCVGALNLGNLERVEIAQLEINESTGYGIKAIGPSGGNNIFGLKIRDSRISVHPYGLWNGGSAPNIAIELWQVNLVGNEIYNTYVDNTISLINSNAIPSTGVQTIRVHHNTFDMETRANGAGYGLELTIHDAEVDHNYFLKGSYGIANWDNPMKNWNIHHNIFYGLQGTYPGEVVRSQWSGLHNVKIYNNTIEFASNKTMNVVGAYGGVSQNVDIKNNVIIDNNTGYSYYANQLVHLENGASVNGLTVSNNSFTRMPVGNVPGNYSNNQTADPKLTKSGVRPTPYYIPLAGSPLINAGVNVGFPYGGSAPDIGAYETGTSSAAPLVVITAPVANSNLTTGSSITVAANATNATFTKVEFYQGATLLGQDTSAPYTYVWPTVPAGNYSLTARATTSQNVVITSTPVSISVTSGNKPPSVLLTSPVNNSTAVPGATVALTATANDPDGTIAKVEFFNGTTKLGEDVTSPYSFVWNATGGTFTFSARALDNLGAVANSATATVVVGSSFVQLNLDSSDAGLSGRMASGSDPSAQRGSYFYVPTGNGTNYYIPPPAAASFNFQISKTDNYVIWAKIRTPVNQGSYVYNGKGKWFTWLAGVRPTWTWVRITENGTAALFPFTQGSNSFQIAWHQENVQVDQVIITNNLSFNP